MSGDDVLTTQSPDEQLVRVRPGAYTAVYVRHACTRIFRTLKLRVDFRLMEHLDIVLSRYYRVLSYHGGRIRAEPHADLTREVSAVLGVRVRADRIPVGRLAELPVHVSVRDVEVDRKQYPLAPMNRYSVIDRVTGSAR